MTDTSTGGLGERLAVAWSAILERFRTSLFGVPSLWVAGSVVLWLISRALDQRIDDVPFETTVDSSRALLGAVASGTIAAASVVFSMTLVAIQLSSSAYSSRVLRTFLRDRFQQNTMGLVVATFFYSLLVLRDVRGPLEEGGTPNVPSVSITIAIALALASILALLASISHTARSVRVSSVSAAVMGDTKRTIREQFGSPASEGAAASGCALDVQAPGIVPSPLGVAEELHDDGPPPRSSGWDDSAWDVVVESLEAGWVQQVAVEALAAPLPAGSVLRLEVGVGTYVFEGAPLCSVRTGRGGSPGEGSPEGRDPGDRVVDQMRSAVQIGSERTLQQDVCFGLTMLEDIALRALSPGVNDPNTAREIIPQLGELTLWILSQPLPPSRGEFGGVTVERPAPSRHLDYLEVAFGQIAAQSGSHAEVHLTLVRTLSSLRHELHRRGRLVPGALEDLEEMIARVS